MTTIFFDSLLTKPKRRKTYMKKTILCATIFILGQHLFAQVTITSFSPISGPVGTSVTITGTDFSLVPTENVVRFGATTVPVISASSSSLTVTVPSGASYQPITVTTNNLTAFSKQPFNVTFDGGGFLVSNSFASAVSFTTGNNPLGVGVNDFDGDGKPDMVLINSFAYDSTISLLRNTSAAGGDITTASFADTVNFVTGNLPFNLATGDIDGDGKPDIAVVNNGNNKVSVFQNTSTPGNISFVTVSQFATGSGPRNVAIGDIDGDGKPDLVVVNDFNNTVSVLRNSGSAGVISFDAKLDFSVGGSPWTVAIGDIDGDGKPDLAVTNSFGFSISVLRNTSSAGIVSFDPKVDFSMGSGGGSVSLGDYDGDGLIDMAAVSFFSGALSVFKNTSSAGSIAFDTRIEYATEVQPGSITTADVDGDGKPDIAITNFVSKSVSVFRNNSVSGTISFEAKVDYATGDSPSSIAVGDLNGDGKPDLVVTNKSIGTVSVLQNILGVALPVNLLNFTGKAVDNKTQLQWQTLNEQKTAKYIVEYAKDGVSFLPIGTVTAKGNTGSLQNNYNFTHVLPQKGINYYRLKITDADARYTYSRIAQVQINSLSQLSMFPNPAKSFVTVAHTASSNSSQLKLIDIMGRTLKIINVVKDAVQTKVDLNGIAAGIYKMVWTDGKTVQSKTLVIQ